MAPCLLLKISGVEVTPSVTSVESSEQFWRKICQIWHICELWTVKKIMWIFTDKEKGYERKNIFGALSVGSGTDKIIIIIIINIIIIIRRRRSRRSIGNHMNSSTIWNK